jgi:hypothetical protein
VEGAPSALINESGAIDDGPAANRNRARRSSRTTETSDKVAAEAFAVETLKFAVDRSKRPVVRCQINQRDKRPAGSERRGCWEQ